MHRILLPLPWIVALTVAVLALSATQPRPARAARAMEDPHARYVPPAPRPADVVEPAASARLARGGKAVLWVYFADKGEAGAREFARAVRLAGDRVTGRLRDRRARETGGKFIPDYYDVPVAPRYVDAVVSTGATIRNVSRWLNAVSVEADGAAVARIASLPFVRSVTAVGRYTGSKPVGPSMPIETGALPGFGSGSRRGLAGALDPPAGYGSSITQLNGIGAKAAQDSGYTGAGVIVAMLDTGYNKTHTANAPLKRIAEYDFVNHDTETANQAGDIASQWDHGTGTWSVLGGYAPNNLIGPAYNASFLLAKTEQVPSETPVEEDNWLAAVEWSDSLGADVISSSLGYFSFDNPADDHTYAQLDGKTAVVTKAAALAARRGIVVASSMANSGPAVGSLTPPADADSILSVGAVDATNVLASFSGRGPTFDGRGKPEVVAQGVFTTWAVAANNTYAAGERDLALDAPHRRGLRAGARGASRVDGAADPLRPQALGGQSRDAGQHELRMGEAQRGLGDLQLAPGRPCLPETVQPVIPGERRVGHVPAVRIPVEAHGGSERGRDHLPDPNSQGALGFHGLRRDDHRHHDHVPGLPRADNVLPVVRDRERSRGSPARQPGAVRFRDQLVHRRGGPASGAPRDALSESPESGAVLDPDPLFDLGVLAGRRGHSDLAHLRRLRAPRAHADRERRRDPSGRAPPVVGRTRSEGTPRRLGNLLLSPHRGREGDLPAHGRVALIAEIHRIP